MLLRPGRFMRGGATSISGAVKLLGAETDGFALDFRDRTVAVRDTATPANNIVGSAAAWLTYASPFAKWIIGQDGLLASGTTLRTEYNGATALGVRIEEARTNLCLWSDDLTNAAWVKTSTTAALTATGPDGVTNSATTVTASGANGTILQSITSASAARFTDCYIKRRTGSGTIEMTQNGGTLWTAVTVTASWTRVSIASATVTNPQVGLRIVTSGDAVDVAFFNCQTGAIQTSPIRTTSTTVTRTADAITADTTKFPLSQTQATVAGEAWNNGQNSGRYIVDLASQPNRDLAGMRIYWSSDTVLNHIVSSNSVLVYNQGIAMSTTPSFHKMAARSATNDHRMAVDGTLTTAGTTGTFPFTTLAAMRLGANLTAGQFLNGHLRTLMYVPRLMSNAELQALST